MSMLPVPTSGGERRVLTRIPGAFINVRSYPDGRDVGDLIIGDGVTYYAPTAKSDGWAYIVPATTAPAPRPAGIQPAAAGWVSLQGGAVNFTVPIVPPTPNPAPTPAPGPSPADVDGALNELNLAVIAQLEANTRVQNAMARLKGVLLPAGGGF